MKLLVTILLTGFLLTSCGKETPAKSVVGQNAAVCSQYDVGQSFPSDDGCNTCSCDQNGKVHCTLMSCGS